MVSQSKRLNNHRREIPKVIKKIRWQISIAEANFEFLSGDYSILWEIRQTNNIKQ
jgi:hypothetical protein